MANLANANPASANTANAVNTSTSVTPGAIPLPRQTADVAVARRPRKNNTFRIVTYVVLSLAAIIYLAPFVWMFSKSLMSLFEAHSTSIIPSHIYFVENYCDVLGEPPGLPYCTMLGHPIQGTALFWQYFWNTVRLEFLSVTGQTIIAILAAYAFARMNFPGRDILFGIFLLTIFVPETVILVPNLVTVSNISHTFEAINPALKWTDNWPALVIPYLSSTFSIFLLRQFFRQIPDDLWDAARLDGAGHLRFLFQIVVPISRAAVTTSILFSFVGVWSALQWPLLVTSSDNWRPIAVALQQYRASGGGAET